MRVKIKRRGGLAGVALAAELDTAELGEDPARRVDAAIVRLLSSRTAARMPHPDAFDYEIVVAGRDEAIRLGENELPSDLEPLLVALSKHGSIERSRLPR